MLEWSAKGFLKFLEVKRTIYLEHIQQIMIILVEYTAKFSH